MSHLVLVNSGGALIRKLGRNDMQSNYSAPDGTRVSLRKNLYASSQDELVGWRGPKDGMESFFHLGTAQGQVRRGIDEECEDETDWPHSGPPAYRHGLTLTIQGESIKDVMRLLKCIEDAFYRGHHWYLHNDWNPKPEPERIGKAVRFLGTALGLVLLFAVVMPAMIVASLFCNFSGIRDPSERDC